MILLRPHIRAARAYEAAWTEKVGHFATLGEIADERQARVQAYVHRRVAEILEAELAADYPTGDVVAE